MKTLAVVVAVVSLVLAVDWTSNIPMSRVEFIEVYVAKAPIPQGTVIEIPKALFAIRDIPQTELPPGALLRRTHDIRNRQLSRALVAGGILCSSDIVPLDSRPDASNAGTAAGAETAPSIAMPKN